MTVTYEYELLSVTTAVIDFAEPWSGPHLDGADECNPDSSQPYPLDGLLARIDDLTR